MDKASKQLSGNEVWRILRFSGFKIREFERYLDFGHGWVNNVLRPMRRIPLRWYDELVNFLGEENFDICMEEINRGNKEYREKLAASISRKAQKNKQTQLQAETEEN